MLKIGIKKESLNVFKGLLNHSLWLAAGSAAGRIAPLGFLFWISSHFPTQDYNSVSTIIMWATVVSALISAGISTVMTHRIAYESSMRSQFSVGLTYYIALLVLCTLAAVLCLLFGKIVSNIVLEKSVNPDLYIPAALTTWAWPQVLFFTSILNGTRKTKSAAILVTLGGLSQGLGMGCAYVFYGADSIAIAWGFSVGSLCAAAMGAAISFVRLTENMVFAKCQKHINFEYLKKSKDSIILNTISSIFVMPIGFFSGTLIAKSENGTQQLAQYFFLEQINQILVYFPAIVGQVLMPSISRNLHGISDLKKEKLIRTTCTTIIKLFFFASVLAGIIGLFVGYAIDALDIRQLGIDAVWATRWMIYNAILTLPLTVLGALIIGTGHIKFGSFSNVLWGLIVLILTSLLTHFGNAGFQAARVFASLFTLFLSITFLILFRPRLINKGGVSKQ